MKPKAKKFSIRRTIGGASGAVRPNQANEAGYDEDDFDDDEQEQQPERLNRLSPDAESFLTPAEEIEKIKAENLTGRQLRIARREAQKHGFNAASDLDAVRLLRKNGVDPFKRSDLLELVVSDQGSGPANLPAAIRHAPPPSTHVSDANSRASEVAKIQRYLARRRSRRSMLLLIKLAFFVFVPTFLAGYYYLKIATPMYSTE